jgi:hypothetical protein
MQADVPAWPCDPIENLKGGCREEEGVQVCRGLLLASRGGKNFERGDGCPGPVSHLAC